MTMGTDKGKGKQGSTDIKQDKGFREDDHGAVGLQDITQPNSIQGIKR